MCRVEATKLAKILVRLIVRDYEDFPYINFGYSVNRRSVNRCINPSNILRNFLNKKGKIKHAPQK